MWNLMHLREKLLVNIKVHVEWDIYRCTNSEWFIMQLCEWVVVVSLDSKGWHLRYSYNQSFGCMVYPTNTLWAQMRACDTCFGGIVIRWDHGNQIIEQNERLWDSNVLFTELNAMQVDWNLRGILLTYRAWFTFSYSF